MKRASLVAALALAACAHAPGGSQIRAPHVVDHAESMAGQVALARQLALVHPVEIEVQPAAEFRASFAAKSAREAKRAHAEGGNLAAAWVAFGFVAPEGSPPDAGVAVDQLGGVSKRVLDEQIAGFYDELDHTLHLPDQLPPSVQVTDAKAQTAVRDFMVAHELEHALQDQHFGFDTLLALPPGSDAQLATNSIYEGDAMLAAVVYMARAYHADEKGMLRFVDRMFAPGKPLGGGEQLSRAPALLRERLVFPYQAGLHLCIAVYRTGGWKLVDALFAHPPQTSEQVLHPEKYLAGEQPIPVRPPEPPEGMRVLARGVLGELGAHVLVDEPVDGWGGDAFTVASADGKALLLLWSTVWDSPEAAQRFEKALRRTASRWRDGPPPDSAPGWTVTAQAQIARRGAQVVLVRGQADPAPLFGLAGPVPKRAPPLGPLALAPEEQRGEVLPDGAYGSAPFGLYVPTPAGFRAIAEPTEMPAAALVIVRPTPYADATFSVIDRAYTHAQANEWFDAALRKESSRELQRAEVSVGEAHGRASLREVAGQRIRTVVVPACGGRSTWVFRLRWKGEEPEGFATWLQAFAPSQDAPACAKP